MNFPSAPQHSDKMFTCPVPEISPAPGIKREERDGWRQGGKDRKENRVEREIIERDGSML